VRRVVFVCAVSFELQKLQSEDSDCRHRKP
jgi:hypothetical protein